MFAGKSSFFTIAVFPRVPAILIKISFSFKIDLFKKPLCVFSLIYFTLDKSIELLLPIFSTLKKLTPSSV